MEEPLKRVTYFVSLVNHVLRDVLETDYTQRRDVTMCIRRLEAITFLVEDAERILDRLPWFTLSAELQPGKPQLPGNYFSLVIDKPWPELGLEPGDVVFVNPNPDVGALSPGHVIVWREDGALKLARYALDDKERHEVVGVLVGCLTAI